MTALLAFAIAAWLDFLWIAYMTSAAKGRAWLAGFVAASLQMSSGVLTLVYVEERSALAGGMVGAFVGTAIAVAWVSGRKEEQS